MSPTVAYRLTRMPRFATVDDYLAEQPAATRARLDELLAVVRAALPDADEAITYDIPTFRRDGRSIVHVAGWQQHVSIYPVPDGPTAFTAAIAPYLSGASTAKFRLRDPLPTDLVAELVRLLSARS
jgi:uncharacterized protein YdhG (YjbR/CyaY superfamily)